MGFFTVQCKVGFFTVQCKVFEFVFYFDQKMVANIYSKFMYNRGVINGKAAYASGIPIFPSTYPGVQCSIAT